VNLLLAVTTSLATTTLLIDVIVMTPKDFEDTCKQTVIIGTLISSIAMIPLNILGMFVLFTKMNNMFNPHRLSAKVRHQKLLNRITKNKVDEYFDRVKK
jgi:high-affinity nickel permease